MTLLNIGNTGLKEARKCHFSQRLLLAGNNSLSSCLICEPCKSLQAWLYELPRHGRASKASLHLQHADHVEALALNSDHAAVLCQGMAGSLFFLKINHPIGAECVLNSGQEISQGPV